MANDNRSYWLTMLLQICDPVMSALANRRLRMDMPIEAKVDRSDCSHLEAAARSLCGMAPWLALDSLTGNEEKLRSHYSNLARQCIDALTDPDSPDYGNFGEMGQSLVDTAFLAHAMIRAPRELVEKLDARVRKQCILALQQSRKIRPAFTNWLLFSGMVEIALKVLGADYDLMRIDYALRQHEQWYKGDGYYGDGPEQTWDYYNSYVIQPMLLDIIEHAAECYPEDALGEKLQQKILVRAQRYAEVLERFIAPDGSFPAYGRSIAYRSGAFQLLAQMALREQLPQTLKAAQVRCALQAVIIRCLEPPGTFDDDGWLRIGLVGHQPSLGEHYISTGSLYLCSVVFLPLGLPNDHSFWSGPDMMWTAQKIWGGQDMEADRGLSTI